MIYFDNAATTKYKPDEVLDALNFYLREIGVSPGRGSYQIGIEASRMLYKSRTALGKFFGMTLPERVIFTKNSTEAMNLFFNGFLKKGDHVIISCYEHNAVLRPIQHLKETRGIEYSIIDRGDLEKPAKDILNKYARENTKLLAMTLASNLTGRIIFREDLYKFFHERGIITFLDSSQGAGKLRPQMKAQYIDYLAFTGHKDLLGIPGCGGLCCEASEHIEPLIQGGTGIHGENYTNPEIFPEGLEAGTLNMPAIWALHAAVEYVDRNFNSLRSREAKLTEYLISQLKTVSNVVLYDADFKRVSTCCFNVAGLSSDKVVSLLDAEGICTRGGIHCAILAHEAIGTVRTGAVRVSLNADNTIEEIDRLISVLKGMR